MLWGGGSLGLSKCHLALAVCCFEGSRVLYFKSNFQIWGVFGFTVFVTSCLAFGLGFLSLARGRISCCWSEVAFTLAWGSGLKQAFVQDKGLSLFRAEVTITVFVGLVLQPS